METGPLRPIRDFRPRVFDAQDLCHFYKIVENRTSPQLFASHKQTILLLSLTEQC